MKKRYLILVALVALLLAGIFLAGRRQAAPDQEPAAAPAVAAAVTGSSPPAANEVAPAATPEDAGIAPADGDNTRAELQTLMDNAEKAIPTRAQLRKLTNEEVHHTPVLVRNAGRQLGRLAEAIARNPALAADTLPFYEKCARNDQYPSSVRALCYSDYERIGNNLKRPVNQDIVPASVRELADKIKGL